MPTVGTVSLPLLALAVISLQRKRLIPQIGEDMLAPAVLQRSYLLDYMLSLSAATLCLGAIVGVTMRYLEFGFGDWFE